MSKSGFIAILGRPNVGKSTLMNALLGQKIAAVSPKPQTTRHKILGIKTVGSDQMLFLDTPGIHRPHKTLNAYMMEVAKAALDAADVFVFVLEPTPHLLNVDREVFQLIADKGKPVVVAVNKVDQVDKKALLPLIDECTKELKPKTVVPICASKAKGVDLLEKELLKYLPDGPLFYPEDQVTDQTERFLAAEIIREKIMSLTKQELPYAVTVLIEAFQEPPEGTKNPLTRINAAIIVEKDSQKGIIIGQKGQMIKKIGQLAREELETLIGTRIYLELFVRVEKDWTKDLNKVREFAYET